MGVIMCFRVRHEMVIECYKSMMVLVPLECVVLKSYIESMANMSHILSPRNIFTSGYVKNNRKA